MDERATHTVTQDDLDALDAAVRVRREADLRLSMSERLARGHELCRQAALIAGAAVPKG